VSVEKRRERKKGTREREGQKKKRDRLNILDVI
jgi:hypothetical protein